MDELAKSEIFFVITTVAVIIVTIAISVLAYYAVKILKNVRNITARAKSETDLIADDIGQLRQNLKRDGAKISHFASFINNLRKKK